MDAPRVVTPGQLFAHYIPWMPTARKKHMTPITSSIGRIHMQRMLCSRQHLLTNDRLFTFAVTWILDTPTSFVGFSVSLPPNAKGTVNAMVSRNLHYHVFELLWTSFLLKHCGALRNFIRNLAELYGTSRNVTEPGNMNDVNGLVPGWPDCHALSTDRHGSERVA